MTNQVPKPSLLFATLLHSDFRDIECLQTANVNRQVIRLKKQTIKRDLIKMEKDKSQYLHLLKTKKDLTANLKELLNYRQSIDYDHQYKQIKFDHYQFPYRDNLEIKRQLNDVRLENTEKRKKIRQMEEELKRKERELERMRREKENYTISQIKNTKQVPTRDNADNFWIKRIQNLKNIYLNSDQDYKRAKIRHDYNLMVEKSGCVCVGHRVCPLCSDLNLETKRNMYSRQALISPRYDSIYGRKRFF